MTQSDGTLRIEPAGAEAAPQVIALIHRVFDEYGFIWAPEEEFWDLLAAAGSFPYLEPRGALWVMRDHAAGADGRVVGSVAVERLDGAAVELHRLYLDARLRGRGLGRRLVDTAVDWARARGARRVALWSDTRFEDAHRLYERLGYVKSGTRALDDVNSTVEFRYERSLSDDRSDATSASPIQTPPRH